MSLTGATRSRPIRGCRASCQAPASSGFNEGDGRGAAAADRGGDASGGGDRTGRWRTTRRGARREPGAGPQSERGGCPRNATRRSITAPISLLGVEAPAVTPITSGPAGSQACVTISSFDPIGL